MGCGASLRPRPYARGAEAREDDEDGGGCPESMVLSAIADECEVSVEDLLGHDERAASMPSQCHTMRLVATATKGPLQPRVSCTEGFVKTEKGGLYSMKIFRTRVPKSRHQKLGPEGLDLRMKYGMHAVGVESSNGVMNMRPSADTKLEEGQFLWFGFEGSFTYSPSTSSCRLPSRYLKALLDFLELTYDEEQATSQLAAVASGMSNEVSDTTLPREFELEYGHLPVFESRIPPQLVGRTLRDAGMRSNAGLSILALGQSSVSVVCFPNPATVLQEGCKMYLAFQSRMLVGKLFLLERRKHGGTFVTDSRVHSVDSL